MKKGEFKIVGCKGFGCKCMTCGGRKNYRKCYMCDKTDCPEFKNRTCSIATAEEYSKKLLANVRCSL